MRKKLPFLIVGSILFLSFVVFSYIVHKNKFQQIDFNTTVRLQDHIPRRVDGVFSTLSLIGGAEVMTVVLLIILFLTRKWVASALTFAMYVGMHIFELFGKTYVQHKPPPQFLLRTQQINLFPQFYVREQYSYPSGHAGRALFVTVIIAMLIWKSKRLQPVHKYILIACLVGYDMVMLVSRVYLGEHWLSDVTGGSLVGAGLSLISSAFFVF